MIQIGRIFPLASYIFKYIPYVGLHCNPGHFVHLGIRMRNRRRGHCNDVPRGMDCLHRSPPENAYRTNTNMMNKWNQDMGLYYALNSQSRTQTCPQTAQRQYVMHTHTGYYICKTNYRSNYYSVVLSQSQRGNNVESSADMVWLFAHDPNIVLYQFAVNEINENNQVEMFSCLLEGKYFHKLLIRYSIYKLVKIGFVQKFLSVVRHRHRL